MTDVVVTDPDGRVEPGYGLGERAMLEAWLDYHRATLIRKCGGLTADELRRRAAPPSDLSLLGLVRHLAEVERNWFRRVLAGEDAPPLYYSDADPDGDIHVGEAVDVGACFQALRDEWERARQLVAQRSLDDAGTRRGQPVSLRWIFVHLIEEYARHNGHADLLREAIDGQTGE